MSLTYLLVSLLSLGAGFFTGCAGTDPDVVVARDLSRRVVPSVADHLEFVKVAVSYTPLRDHATSSDRVGRLLNEKKKEVGGGGRGGG
ncbi:MAG: hypothetical protein K2I52_06090, partial [Muribaculaceae bacterium]|nr:hypothetical protein [Muribaculaceae bacterium]